MFSFTVRRLVGASAAVCLAASAVVVGSVAVPGQILALPGASESTVVTIEPTRVTDTRHDIGVTGKVVANAPRKLTVTGTVDTYIDATSQTVAKQVVPNGATGVFLNVTVVTPSAPGFLSIRPGTATGVPATAGLNFDTQTALANGVLVALPTAGSNAGQIDIYYGTPTPGASVHVIIDVVGYTTNSGLIDLVNRVEQLEASASSAGSGGSGGSGSVGATGATGATGPSDAFVSHISGGQDQSSARSTVTSVSVPAGSYVVSAKLYGIADATTGNHYLTCRLQSGTDDLDKSASKNEPEGYSNLSLAGSVTLTSPGTLLLACESVVATQATVAAPYTLYGISLTAIKVGTLN